MLCDFRDATYTVSLRVDAVCIYLGLSRTICCRNLRVTPLYCEGVGFRIEGAVPSSLEASNCFSSLTTVHLAVLPESPSLAKGVVRKYYL